MKIIHLIAFCLRLPNEVLSDNILGERAIHRPLMSLTLCSESLDMLVILLRSALNGNKTLGNAEESEVLAQYTEAFRSVWYPTWVHLKVLPLPDTNRILAVDGLQLSWYSIQQICQFEICDSKIQNPEPFRLPIHQNDRWWKVKGCSWEDCLCATMPHHRLKFCKRCRQAIYCSLRCQTL